MTRLQRLSPILLGALMAACSEAQPYLQPVAPAAGQAVVVDAGQGDRTARLDLRAAAAYALQQATTVHRWVSADLVRYEVELRVRNATTATQYDAVGNNGLTAQVPVNGQGAGSATFTKLRQGNFYRAYVKAMGKAGGASAQGNLVQMNAQAPNDHVDFDFTAANDLAQEVSRTVTVNFDGVAFSGTGALSFGSPSPGAYVAPSDGPAVAVSNPPTPTPSPTPTPTPSPTVQPVVGNLSAPVAVAFDAAGNAWVANSAGRNVTKLTSAGGLVATYSVALDQRDVLVDGLGQVWVAANNQGLHRLDSNGSLLGSTSISGGAQSLALDPSGSLWVGSNTAVYKLSSTGQVLSTLNVAGPKIAISTEGHLWGGASIILKFDATGNILASVGLPNSATELAIASDQSLWVGVQSTSHVLHLSSNGAILGTHPVGSSPRGLAIDGQGNVWVANSNSNNVTKLSSSGAILGTFTVGTFPIGVDVDAQGRVWVANTGADSLSIIR